MRRTFFKNNKLVTWLLIAFVLLWTLIPLYWFLSMAFKTPVEIASFPPTFFPHNPTLLGLYNVLGFEYTLETGEVFLPSGQARQVVTGLLNSFILACIVSVITIILNVSLGYNFG
mgnify:CR=1 FL=1